MFFYYEMIDQEKKKIKRIRKQKIKHATRKNKEYNKNKKVAGSFIAPHNFM